MESTSSTAERLSALEHRVTELENMRAPASQDAPADSSAAGSATAGSATAGSGRAADADVSGAVAAGAVAAEANAGGSGAGNADLPGDADTFWALHGLVDHLGEEGGVTFTGYTTPPGADGPVAWQMGLSSAGLGDIDFAEAAGSLAALGHPARLQLLQSIYEGTTTVAELGKDERFGTTGQIYHHVHALASAGWLENARRGHWRVPATRIIPLLTLVLIGTH